MEGDGGKALLELGAAGLEPGGKAEAFAEGLGGLVDGEAGIVGGELEEDAAGFAEVDGVEVLAVEDFGSGEVLGDLGAPFQLGGVVGGAEGDVVDGAGAGAAEVGGWVDEDIDVVAEGGWVGGRGEAEAIALGGGGLEAHEGEGAGRLGGVELQHGDAVEAADGVGGGDVGEAGSAGGGGGGVGDEFDLHAGGVGEGEELFVEAARAAVEGDVLVDQALLPEGEGVGRGC